MNAKTALWALALALVWAFGTHAQAQTQVTIKRTISFETDCVGNNTPGDFDGLFGYKVVPDDLYAACGVSSITSGGQLGKQQLHRPASQLIPGTLDGMDGQVALAGSFSTDQGALTFGDVVIIFSPAVNEVSFDVLSVENTSGLSVTLQAAGGVNIPVTQPTIVNDKTHFSATSSTPIERVRISYVPGAILDGWFVDSLSFNAWKCGDGEKEPGAGEQCDDANPVQCDSCRNDCKQDIVGCLDGTTCIADGASAAGSFGCASCDLNAQPNQVGEFLPVAAPNGQSCDDALFCTDAEACDGHGVCSGQAHDCGDALECTQDLCDEAQNQCSHPILVGTCLISGTCFANHELNPQNPCETCAHANRDDGWTPVASGATCGSPSCAGGVLAPAPRCDGAASCQQQPTQACDGAVCADAQSCTASCRDDAECLVENHCVNGTCKPDLDNGKPCTRASECNSGFCADGFCCNADCGRVCESCNAPGSEGTCTGYAAGTDPEHECPNAQLCAAAGKCAPEDRSNGEACDQDAVCKSGHCADGVCCSAACDRSCESCNAPNHVGTCTAYEPGTDPEHECPNAQLCAAAGVCAPEDRPNGAACDQDAVCKSGHCADGMCCNTACNGECEACNVENAAGECTPFAAGTDPANECAGAQVCSGSSSCVSYETRGNGLCTFAPGSAPAGAWLGGALLGLCGFLRGRRRRR